MLSGLKEIIIILSVLAGLFIIPRIIRMKSGDQGTTSKKPPQASRKDSGFKRLAILLTGLWVVLAFVFLRPLSGNVMPFLAAGVLPMVVAWGIRWVVLGFK